MTNEKTTPTEIEVAEKGNQSIAQPLDYNIDGFLKMRGEFIEKVNKTFVVKQDYHIIQGKKSMAKGGAEKIASIFGWQASFKKDEEALQMLGDLQGVVCFICTLTKNGEFVGEGRGSSSLLKNQNDPNKTLKMAQKSAFIDAVLRTSGLSDFFTQDLEDMPAEQISQPVSRGTVAKPASKELASAKQIDLIVKLATEKGVIDNIDPVKLDHITKNQASQWIEKLMTMKKQVAKEEAQERGEKPLPTIEIGRLNARYLVEDMPE